MESNTIVWPTGSIYPRGTGSAGRNLGHYRYHADTRKFKDGLIRAHIILRTQKHATITPSYALYIYVKPSINTFWCENAFTLNYAA